jgi:hypothetical protein
MAYSRENLEELVRSVDPNEPIYRFLWGGEEAPNSLLDGTGVLNNETIGGCMVLRKQSPMNCGEN